MSKPRFAIVKGMSPGCKNPRRLEHFLETGIVYN
jgi:hypothetical protein